MVPKANDDLTTGGKNLAEGMQDGSSCGCSEGLFGLMNSPRLI
jgi:hypothetical protein